MQGLFWPSSLVARDRPGRPLMQDKAKQKAPEAPKTLYFFHLQLAEEHLDPNHGFRGRPEHEENAAAAAAVEALTLEELAVAQRLHEQDQARYKRQAAQHMAGQSYSEGNDPGAVQSMLRLARACLHPLCLASCHLLLAACNPVCSLKRRKTGFG